MDGPRVNTSPLQNLANYVRRAALDAGYEIERVNSGELTRLANTAGMSQSSLSRLLAAERMPRAEFFAGLAHALGKDPLELFVEAGMLPRRSAPDAGASSPTARPITPDDVADAWQVDAFGREMVHAMFARLAKPSKQADSDGLGNAAAPDGQPQQGKDA